MRQGVSMTDRLSDQRSEPELHWVARWLPHDDPERPFNQSTWLDECRSCVLALRAEAAMRPRLVLLSKTGADRMLVTADYAARWWSLTAAEETGARPPAGTGQAPVTVPTSKSVHPPGPGGLDIFRRSPTSPRT